MIEDVGFALNSLDANIAYLPGKALKIYSKTSFEIKPGDPMHPGLMGYKVAKENRRIVANIEAENSVYGISYTVSAVPVHNESGQVIGSLVMVFVRKLLAMKKVPSLGRKRADRQESLSKPKAAQFFSMKSVRCIIPCRLNCCGFCRNKSLSGSAARACNALI